MFTGVPSTSTVISDALRALAWNSLALWLLVELRRAALEPRTEDRSMFWAECGSWVVSWEGQ